MCQSLCHRLCRMEHKSAVQRALSVVRYHIESHINQAPNTLTGLRKRSDRLMDFLIFPSLYAGDSATLVVSMVGLPDVPFLHL